MMLNFRSSSCVWRRVALPHSSLGCGGSHTLSIRRCISKSRAPFPITLSSSTSSVPAQRSFTTTAPETGCFVLPKRDKSVLLGCVSYDPAVGTIWSMMRQYLLAPSSPGSPAVPGFDFVLYSNYEQQVRALLEGDIDIAWNGPLAHVMCESQADIVSLGMRDVDCDFESVVVVTKQSGIQTLQDLQGAHMLSGDQDSPQGHVIPMHYLRSRNIEFTVEAQNEDIGKHGDTALGEIKAMQALASAEGHQPTAQGALLSRMMWDRAIQGELETVNSARLKDRATLLGDIKIPKFDHCQFDALKSTADSGKLDSFYTALHGMNYDDPDQQPVMKLEGLRRSWAKPRQEGYDIVRAAMGVAAGARRAQNYVPKGSSMRAFSTGSNVDVSKNSRQLPPGSSVGVIGCGVAGLQVIRSLRARGYDVTAFDKADDVGGLWRENYANFGLQVPKQFFEMPDLEMKEASWGELASGPKVQAYIKRFASEFNLLDAVQLKTGIEQVSKSANDTWTFHTNTGEQHNFDYCIVSTGMYSTVPFEPDVPGRNTFSGSAIHSGQFKDAQSVKDKRVIVVGGGKSATDCATSAANAGAESVILVQRRAHWPTPLHIAGLIPFQHVFLSRLGQALVEAKVGIYPGSQSSASLFKPLMGAVFGIVEQLFAFQFGLKGDLRPQNGVVEDFYGFAAVQDNSFKALRDAGKVEVRLGEIESFTKEGVRLNGEELAADQVVFATGFAKDYAKLFEPDVVKCLDVQKDGIYLYKRILPPSVHNLAFIGSEAATIFNCTCSGLQAEWLARVLAGETQIDDLSDEALANEANAFRDFARSWMPSTSSRSALVLLHQLHYYDQLLMDMGENPSRKSNVVAEYLGSYYCQDYNGIVGRPSRATSGAATAAS